MFNFNSRWAKISSCKKIYCGNTTGNTPGKVSYFQCPSPKTERKQAEIGLKTINTRYNTNTFKFLKDDVICSFHFHQNCFQIDVKAKLLGDELKGRTLKLGTLPTIFKHKVFHIINMNSETAGGIRSHKRIQNNEHFQVFLVTLDKLYLGTWSIFFINTFHCKQKVQKYF